MPPSSHEGTATEDVRRDAAGALSADISNRIVSLLKHYTGRGPTKARTYLHDRMVICVLENALTRGEQQMAEHGEEEQAIESRRTFQRLIREDAKAMVEEVTGRAVVSFLSDNSLDPDIGIEAFVLADSDGARDESPVLEAG